MTSTDSATLPTFSETSTVVAWASRIKIPGNRVVSKPTWLTETTYVPTGRLKIWKNPDFCVVVVWTTLIAASVTFTEAPTTAAPDGSSTVPFSDPRVCCAKPGNAEHKARVKSAREHNPRRIRWIVITALQSVGLCLTDYGVNNGHRRQREEAAKAAECQARGKEYAETRPGETGEAICKARMPRFPQEASLQTLDEDPMNGAMRRRGQGTGGQGGDGAGHGGANLRTSRGLPGDSMGGNDRRVASIVDLLSCPHANAMQSRNTNA